MDFFNSLAQIAKNKDNFKKWEADQQNEQARREELYKRRQYSDEEIAKAKALGENIIDVIDIMDNHSESVAENVETATQPLIATAPFLGLGLSGFAAYKLLIKQNLKKGEKIYQETIRSEEAKKLCYEIENYNIENNIHKKIGRVDLTDEKFIKEIANPQLKERAYVVYNKYKKAIKPLETQNRLGVIGVIAAALASFVGINIYAAKLQVDSSKIARYQARESLKDPKAFVNYTPEQITKAKEEIENNPELKKQKKKEKLNTGFFKSLINLFKDRRAYKEAVKNDKDESKLVTRELTPEEIKAAKEDQEIIQRSIRLINNEAEKYSQNMEVAANVLINGTPYLGALIGGAIGWILNKIGVIEKIIDKSVNNNGSQKTKDLYADLKKGKESGKSVHSKWFKFMDSFMDDLRDNENNIKTEGKSEKEIKELRESTKGKPRDFWKRIKRFGTAAFAHPWGRNGIISVVGAIITGIAGAFIGLKLQKSASRAGRYTAKRELEKDPRNFIGYTQDDYNEVSDVKSDKNKKSKVIEVITFIPTCIKQYYAYEKFRKNEYKENKLLQEQLMKQEVSEEQLRDAKNLQRKLFNTFEKVDDNSQLYSESMEAAIDIAQPFVTYGAALTAVSPLFVAGYLVYKGKLSFATVLNKFAGFLNKSSERMKSKWFKNYLKEVAKNVSTKVQNTQVSSKPIGAITKGINLKTDPVITILSKTFANLKSEIKNLAKIDPDKQGNEIFLFKQSIRKVVAAKNPEIAGKISGIIDNVMYRTRDPQVRADALTILMEPSAIKGMGKERYDKAYKFLSRITEEAIADTGVVKDWNKAQELRKNLYVSIQEMFDTVDTNKLRVILDKVEKIDELKGLINRQELEKIIVSIEKYKPVHVNTERLQQIVAMLKANPELCKVNNYQTVNPAKIEELIEKIKNSDVDFVWVHTHELEKLKQSSVVDKNELEALIKSIEQLSEQNRNNASVEGLQNILSHENVSGAITQFEKIREQIKKIPNLLEENPELKGLLNQISESQQIPLESLKPQVKDMLLKEGLIKPEQETVSIMDIPRFLEYVKSKATSLTIQDLMKVTLPPQMRNPKGFIGEMKKVVERMSDEEFLNKMEALNLSRLKMDKKTMLEILPKIEKMIDNVPKEEMQQIWDTILKEMSEHPDEFLKLVTEGNPASIIITPGLKKALAAAGISWSVFMIVMTYAVESWLADIKLKAGRLGVMKAIESLDDYRYYANIEQTQKSPQAMLQNSQTQDIPTIPQTTNLLSKYKKV